MTTRKKRRHEEGGDGGKHQEDAGRSKPPAAKRQKRSADRDKRESAATATIAAIAPMEEATLHFDLSLNSVGDPPHVSHSSAHDRAHVNHAPSQQAGEGEAGEMVQAKAQTQDDYDLTLDDKSYAPPAPLPRPMQALSLTDPTQDYVDVIGILGLQDSQPLPTPPPPRSQSPLLLRSKAAVAVEKRGTKAGEAKGDVAKGDVPRGELKDKAGGVKPKEQQKSPPPGTKTATKAETTAETKAEASSPVHSRARDKDRDNSKERDNQDKRNKKEKKEDHSNDLPMVDQWYAPDGCDPRRHWGETLTRSRQGASKLANGKAESASALSELSLEHTQLAGYVAAVEQAGMQMPEAVRDPYEQWKRQLHESSERQNALRQKMMADDANLKKLKQDEVKAQALLDLNEQAAEAQLRARNVSSLLRYHCEITTALRSRMDENRKRAELDMRQDNRPTWVGSIQRPFVLLAYWRCRDEESAAVRWDALDDAGRAQYNDIWLDRAFLCSEASHSSSASSFSSSSSSSSSFSSSSPLVSSNVSLSMDLSVTQHFVSTRMMTMLDASREVEFVQSMSGCLKSSPKPGAKLGPRSDGGGGKK